MSRSGYSRYFIFFSLFLVFASTAYAETTLEEIIVTAQKREQSSQDIGYSVTAFSGDRLKELGITKSEDIAGQVPNLGIRNVLGNSFPIISIRGVSLVDTKANNVSSAAVHIDEVYFGSPVLIGLQLFDLERTEVLKGPQGTLFGRNTTAGSVNFISKKPTTESDGFINGALGRFDEARIETGFNIPVSDTLKLRAAGVYETSDGYTKNRLTGKNLGGDNRAAVRVLADWDASDNINVLFNLHGGTDKSEVGAFQHRALLAEAETCASANSNNPTNTAGCTDLLGYADIDNNPFSGDYNIEGEYDNKQFGASVTINWNLDGISITSITAHDQFTRKHQEDNDASPNRFVDQNYDEEFKNFAQEIRFASINESALTWIVGLYYATEEIDLIRDADLTDLIGSVLDFEGQEDRTAFAVYGHTEWKTSEKLKFTFGLRYTDEKKEYNYLNNTEVLTPFSASVDFGNVSGRLGLDYFMNEDVLIHSSISQGFKSGGWPSGITESITTLVPYDEEEVIAYEIGIKSTWLKQTLRFNASAFYYDYKDLQQFTFIPQGAAPPLQIFGNASNASVQGLEFELQWLPTERFEIQLGLGILDAEYDNFNALGSATDLSGQSLPNAPETNFNGSMRYTIPTSFGGTFYFQSDAVYESDFSFAIEEKKISQQDDYLIVNARAGYQSENEKWDVALWSKNITDEEYLVSAIDTGLGYALQAFGRPATFGITAIYRWD